MGKNILIVMLLCLAFSKTIAKEVEFTPEYADTCYLRGITEFYNQNYSYAKKYFEISCEINDSIVRREPFISSNATYWIAHILYLEGRKEEAQALSIDYCFVPVDQRVTRQSDSLWALASERSDLKQSLFFSKMARKIEITNLGQRHYYIANSNQQIASIYMQLNQWDSAKYYQEEAISIFEEWISTDFTQNYVGTLLEYIRTCVHLSDMYAYENIINKCKGSAQQLFGGSSINYAYTLYEISRANNYFNDFVDCISNSKEAVNIYSRFLPSKEVEMQLVLCYQLLGNAYGYIHNNQDAKSYLQKANDILEKNKNIADEILFDIAYYQGKCGEYYDAISTYRKLINLLEEYCLQYQPYEKHFQELLVSSHLDISEIYYSQKRIDSTIEYANRGLVLAKKYNIFSKQLEALQTLSLCYFEQALYDKAIELQEYIWREDSNNLTNIYNMMWSYYATKNKNGFYKCATRYYSYEKNDILSTLSRIYEKNRLDFLKDGEFDRFGCLIRFARYYNNEDSICCLAYDSELFRKGLLLVSSIEFSRMIDGSDEEKKDYQYLLNIRERLNHPVPDQERMELLEKEQQIEGMLLKKNPRWAENIKQLQCTWKDVQKKLKNGEVAIEFAEDVSNGKNKMIALIVRKGWNSPRCVVLNEFDCNDDKLRKYKESSFLDIALSNSIWGDIITEAQLFDGDTVFFAPNGVFMTFPIESLCDPNNPAQTISDRFNMVRLSSTREICTRNEKYPMSSISLYGNLLYDISEDKKIANSRKYTPSLYCAVDNKRSLPMHDTIRSGYRHLYWTKSEIDSIEKFAIQYMPQMSVSKYELDMGTEESFKGLSKKNTSIIHLATHAFYYNDTSNKKNHHSEGLLLAGCNTTCKDSIYVEDGILCSSEIELLDFTNTFLVVLSGCNTGLGNYMVDGIGGLQRAFKKAGAGTIIMSLWEVSDVATSYFMQNFYKILFKTKSKRDAFSQAQQLTKNKFENPLYWAAFIMLD